MTDRRTDELIAICPLFITERGHQNIKILNIIKIINDIMYDEILINNVFCYNDILFDLQNMKANHLFLTFYPLVLVPYRQRRRGLLVSSRSVCLSVCPSVRLSVSLSVRFQVFRTFFCNGKRYWDEIWYTASSWLVTEQVRVWSRLTHFCRSYAPW